MGLYKVTPLFVVVKGFVYLESETVGKKAERLSKCLKLEPKGDCQ